MGRKAPRRKVNTNTVLEYKGEKKTAKQWFSLCECKITWEAFKRRLEMWDIGKALTAERKQHNVNAYTEDSLNGATLSAREIWGGVTDEVLKDIMISGNINALLAYNGGREDAYS